MLPAGSILMEHFYTFMTLWCVIIDVGNGILELTEFNLNQIYMSKSIKLNSKDIINIRKNLDAKINKYCKIIRTENVIATKAIKANQYSGFDLKSLYNEIQQMRQKRIKIKGILFNLNMGITSFNFEEFKKTNNYAIFAAGEAKEAIAQLKMIPTLNPTEKAKKGLKNLSKKETFSSAKITALIKQLQCEANKYDADLEKFNNETSIECDIADDFKEFIAA